MRKIVYQVVIGILFMRASLLTACCCCGGDDLPPMKRSEFTRFKEHVQVQQEYLFNSFEKEGINVDLFNATGKFVRVVDGRRLTEWISSSKQFRFTGDNIRKIIKVLLRYIRDNDNVEEASGLFIRLTNAPLKIYYDGILLRIIYIYEDGDLASIEDCVNQNDQIYQAINDEFTNDPFANFIKSIEGNSPFTRKANDSEPKIDVSIEEKEQWFSVLFDSIHKIDRDDYNILTLHNAFLELLKCNAYISYEPGSKLIIEVQGVNGEKWSEEKRLFKKNVSYRKELKNRQKPSPRAKDDDDSSLIARNGPRISSARGAADGKSEAVPAQIAVVRMMDSPRAKDDDDSSLTAHHGSETSTLIGEDTGGGIRWYEGSSYDGVSPMIGTTSIDGDESDKGSFSPSPPSNSGTLTGEADIAEQGGLLPNADPHADSDDD